MHVGCREEEEEIKDGREWRVVYLKLETNLASLP
jgi:hypothetical protein